MSFGNSIFLVIQLKTCTASSTYTHTLSSKPRFSLLPRSQPVLGSCFRSNTSLQTVLLLSRCPTQESQRISKDIDHHASPSRSLYKLLDLGCDRRSPHSSRPPSPPWSLTLPYPLPSAVLHTSPFLFLLQNPNLCPLQVLDTWAIFRLFPACSLTLFSSLLKGYLS